MALDGGRRKSAAFFVGPGPLSRFAVALLGAKNPIAAALGRMARGMLSDQKGGRACPKNGRCLFFILRYR